MPSLKEIIARDTYVEIARKNGGKVTELESGAMVSPPRPSPSTSGPTSQAIWYWELKTSGSDLSTVHQLECWSRSMAEAHGGNASMGWFTVCPSIKFGKENLSTKERGVFLVRTNDRVFLPLTKKYLWKAFSLAGGKNPGTAGDPNTWWPLPSVIDSGFSQVFVYELLPGMAAVPNPIPTDDPDFADNVTVFPEPGVDPTQPGQSSVGVNQKGTGTIGGKDYSQRHFVCVVMSLICNTERADFEPGALVGMGRTIPHLQILSSKNVEKGEAVLELQRPNRSGYYGTVDNSDGVRVMNHPDMDVNVGALLVTDTNAFRGTDNFNLVNLPYWDLIFDYIAAENLPSGNVTVVDRLRRGTRKVAGAIKVLDYDRVGKTVRKVLASGLVAPLVSAILGPFGAAAAQLGMSTAIDVLLSRPALRLVRGTGLGMGLIKLLFGASLVKKDFLPRKSVDFDKLDRQGAFDSIHLAPRMKAHKLIAPGGADEQLDDATYSLSSIAMAPFCEHDCFHTHWRWGKNWDDPRIKPLRKNELPLRGFGDDSNPKFLKTGRPCAPGQIGKTMVPINQTIDITVVGGNRLVYEVSINGDGESDKNAIRPGVWQVCYHHGSAYALSITDKKNVEAAQMVIGFSKEFSELYWNMRFQGATDGKEERIQVDDLTRCMNT